jgi:hypothetical protein
MYINQDLAVVSCDKKVSYPEKVAQNDTHLIDSLLDMFNMVPGKRQLQHYVFQLFDYIENIRATDEDRKEQIHKLVRKVNDYKTMIKTYLIYRTLSHKCGTIKGKKTILKDEDTVQMVNPFYISCNVPFNTRIKCAWKHLYKSKFGKADADCHAPCETCTFRNSVGRLTRKYGSLFSGGCNASVVRSMIHTYYRYLVIGKEKSPPTGDIMAYLNSLPLSTLPNSEVDPIVYEKFESFICKYDIQKILEEELTKRIQEKLDRGYELPQLLAFIRDDSKQVKVE